MPKTPRKIRFLYTGVRVRDLARSVRFYKAMGMRELFRGKMEHGGEYVHLSFPGSYVRLELNYYPKGNKFDEPWGPGSEFDHLGFRVDDPDRWIAKLKKAGATDLIAAWTEGSSRIGYVQDPDGVTLEFFGPSATPKPRRPARSTSARRSKPRPRSTT